MKITVGPSSNLVFQPATDRGRSAQITIGSGGGGGSTDAYPQANAARNQANAAYGQANSAYNAANNAQVTVFANNQSSKTTQNLNFVNTTTILVTVDADGPNANISFLTSGASAADAYIQANNARNQANTARDTANGAYAQANLAYGQANAVYDAANNRVLKAGDTMTGNLNVAAWLITQNVVPAQNNLFSLGSSDFRFKDLYVGGNTVYIGDAILSSQGSNVTTETFIANTSFLSGGFNVLNQANSAYDAANSASGIAINAYNQANSARTQANNAYAEANIKLNLTGGTINGSLNVSGNLSVTGNTTYYNVTTYIVDDPLIYLAANNDTSDLVDIGFIGAKNTGGTYSHTGLARDAGDGTWYLFDNLIDEGHENNVIDFANTTLATLRANINANSILLTGLSVATQANLTLAHNQANNARDTANGAYSQANAARLQANTARDQANTAYGQTNAAYGQANTARDTANGAYAQANGAYNQANSARDQANTARTQANTARDTANNAYNAANNAQVSVYANNGSIVTTSKINFVNTSSIIVSVQQSATNANISFTTTGASAADAYDQANAARLQANTARTTANNAYDAANNRVLKAGDTMTGNLIMSGATINTSVANISTIVTGNALTISTGTGSNGNIVLSANGTEDMRIQANGFITIGSVANPNSNLTILGNLWVTTGINAETVNATTGNIATLAVENIAVNNTITTTGSGGDISGVNTIYAGTFATTAGLNVTAQAANAYNQANNAANTARVSANGGSTLSAKQLNFINTATISVSVSSSGDGTNANIAFSTSGAAAGDAYDQANNARNQANTARTTANDAYAGANTANTNALNAYGQANTARVTANDAYAQANTARNQANTARTTANDAYGQANTANTNALNAYGQANTARTTANDAYGQANTARDTANNAYNAANNAQVTIFANSGSSVTTQNINFVNTSTVSVTVTNSSGNANISFTSAGGGQVEQQYNTTTTSIETVDEFSATLYRSGKYQMQVENFSGFLALDIMLLHNGSTANLIQYGTTTFGGNVGSFSSDLSGGNVRLRFTATDPTSSLTYYRSLLSARASESLPTDLMTGSDTYDLMLNLTFSPTDLMTP